MIYGILKAGYVSGAVVTDADVETAFVAPLSIINNQPAFVQDSMNLKRRASLQGVQRWEIIANLEPSNNSAAMLLHSVDKNVVTPINVRMPQIVGLKIITKNKLKVGIVWAVNGNKSRGDSSISIQTATSDLPDAYALTPGEFITFEGHTKVYLVKTATNTNITISPPLMTTVSSGAALRRDGDTVLSCRYDSDTVLGIKYIDGVLSDPGSVKLIEDI